MDSRFSGIWRNTGNEEVFFLLWISVSDTPGLVLWEGKKYMCVSVCVSLSKDLKQTPRRNSPPDPGMANPTSYLPPVPRPRARHTAFWISKGGKHKGNPHPNLPANTHTHVPQPPSQNNSPLCPSCQSKPHQGHAWRVWISGISIQCHAPWDPVRGPLEYISIALSPCITTLFSLSTLQNHF